MGKGEKEESWSDSESEQEDSCSSEPSVESQIMWLDDWDAPLLDILDDACAGKYPSIGVVFTNKSWRVIASLLQKALVGEPLIKSVTPDDCKKRGKYFRKMYHDSKAITDPSPREEQLSRIYSPKSVTKFPRRTANPISISSMLSSSGPSSGSGSKSKSGAKHWKSDLVVALANLVSSHNLNLQAVDCINDKLDTEMKVMVFLGLDPDTQMREAGRLVGSCAFVPVESPPLASRLNFHQRPPLNPLND